MQAFQCAGIEAVNDSLPSSGPPEIIGQPSVQFEHSDPLPLMHPEAHHHILNTQQFYENIPQWLDQHDGDLALVVCLFFI